MKIKTTFFFSIGALALAACEHNDAATADSSNAAMAKPEMMAAETAQSIDVTIVISANANGDPYFSSAGYSYRQPGGGDGSGITLDTGNVDLSVVPDGIVNINVNIDPAASNFSYPSDPYQAVALTIIPPGVSTPTPVFGQQFWPTAEFGPPTLTANLKMLAFSDRDDDGSAYEYSIAVNTPKGRVVLDPKISNKNRNR